MSFKKRPKSQQRRKQVGDYIVDKAIGFGAFSTVYVGYNIKTELRVAIKAINLHRINFNTKHETNLKQEIDILRKCRHPNIVQLLHTYQTSNHIYLIMQYCSAGDLFRFIQNHGRLSEIVAKGFAIQLCKGLEYLHSLNIIHRDLKPQNILLSIVNNSSSNASPICYILRIADFGFARYFQPNGGINMVDTMCGSPLYMAPEILKFSKYDSKVDLWSAGTIIYQMLTKNPPFFGSNHIQLLKKIENCRGIQFPAHLQLSEECKHLLEQLLKRNPVQRISWEGFFQHPWLQKKNEQIEQKMENKMENVQKRMKKIPEQESVKYDNYIVIDGCLLTDMHIQYKYAIIILQIADFQVAQTKIASALLLYIRGLDILENVINLVCNQYKEKYKALLNNCLLCYAQHIKRSFAVKNLCESQSLPFVFQSLNMDIIIFQYAIDICRVSCADIILNIGGNDNQYVNNHSERLHQCLLMFKYLLTLKYISNVDRIKIQTYLSLTEAIANFVDSGGSNKLKNVQKVK